MAALLRKTLFCDSVMIGADQHGLSLSSTTALRYLETRGFSAYRRSFGASIGKSLCAAVFFLSLWPCKVWALLHFASPTLNPVFDAAIQLQNGNRKTDLTCLVGIDLFGEKYSCSLNEAMPRKKRLIPENPVHDNVISPHDPFIASRRAINGLSVWSVLVVLAIASVRADLS